MADVVDDKIDPIHRESRVTGLGRGVETSGQLATEAIEDVYGAVGDYQATLRSLRDFEPGALRTGGFDSRWGMLGRVRLLRAAAFEQLGRRAEARAEYKDVLSQWRTADPVLQPFVRQAERGLARVGEAG